MSAPPIASVRELLERVRPPKDLRLDCSILSKGNDNYHIDVELSRSFVSLATSVIEEMVKRTVAGRRPTGQPDDMEALRDAYDDMVKDSLHRTKTDLKPAQVRVLQFAIIKFLLSEVRAQLDLMVKQVEETLGQQQYSGSRNLLVTQEKFTWIRKHYPTFLYRANRAILRHLQKQETNQLRPLRDQFLGDELSELPNILFNPMLAAASPVEPHLLLESYALWSGGGKEIVEANARLEAFSKKRLPALQIKPLREIDKIPSGHTEVYDELGGLFAAQPYIGPSIDQKDQVVEDFCWLDHPGYIRFVFDASVHERTAAKIEGRAARWKFRSDAKKLVRLGAAARASLLPDKSLKEVIAGYVMRDEWLTAYDELIDPPTACAYVAGNDAKKILLRIDQAKDGAQGLIKQMNEWAKEADRIYNDELDEISLRVLTDLARFRLHLQYYRFAHRIFNRLNVITEPQEIQLAKAGGHLYRLPGSDTVSGGEAREPQIIHHTILKADVRGSTVVTQELIRQGLNPASYFSTRFFGPINELLGVYGAVKVFIEGDAVILGLYEHDTAPEEWYSVARACGIAKEMLDIITSKNTHSRQTGLPALEIGIGICYADERPLFLFDEDKPIMISPAIGDADRMSSCSWKLRHAFESGNFNVEVLEIAESDRERGEKGQQLTRYNVNGILLADGAFAKLNSEITLNQLNVKSGDAMETMFVGRFPDVHGKVRDLVIREGKVGRWENEQAFPGEAGGSVFYEVLPNSKFASQVLEFARNQASSDN